MKSSEHARLYWLLALTGVGALVAGPAAGQIAGQASDERTDERPVVADDQAWVSASPAGDLGDPVGQATFASDDLPVGLVGTDEFRRSYLLLDVAEDAVASTIVLPLSDTAGGNVGTAGSILACFVTEPFDVERGDSLEEAPAVDCDDEIVGVVVEPQPSGDGDTGEEQPVTYAFDLTPLLARDAPDGATGLGVALVADARAPGEWQVTFRAELFAPIGTYRLPVEPSESPSPTPPPPTPEPSESAAPSSEPTAAPTGQQGPGPEEPERAIDLPPPVSLDEFPPPPAPSTVPTPQVAAPADVDDDRSEPQQQPVALARVPLDPLPVNPAVWIIPPVGVAVLWVSGRSLGGAGQAPSSLDRLLAR